MDEFIGTIKAVVFNYAPEGGWLLCDGQELQISQYQPLYALIGTTYGGNGSTTFKLPDLRGRFMLGDGQLSGGSLYRMGQQGGSETSTITPANLPVKSGAAGAAATETTTVGNLIVPNNGASMNNMPPYVVVNYIICANGIWPSRS